MSMKTLFMLFLMASVVTVRADRYSLRVDVDSFYTAVVNRENVKWDVNAVGDKHLRHKAYGLLQIRQPYLDDVNKIAGKDVLAVWSKSKLTLADMKDPEMAKWAFRVYLNHYGESYEKNTGKAPTAEVYARIHNGGPNGWKNKKTVAYGRDVINNLQKGK